jgi:hypothetical protein
MRLAAVLGLAVLAAGAAAAAALGGAPPKHAFTPAGNALAKSIVLRAADVPKGFTAQPGNDPSAGAPTCSYYSPDPADLTAVGRAASAFAGAGGFPTIGATAAVFASPSQAATAYARIVRPELAKCLAEIVARGLPKGTTLAITSISTRKIAGVGDKAVLIELDGTVATKTDKATVYLYAGAVNRGSVDADIYVVGLDAPVPGLQLLLAKLAGRIR